MGTKIEHLCSVSEIHTYKEQSLNRSAEPNVDCSVGSNVDCSAESNVGVGFIPILQGKWIAEPNVGVGFIPILQGQDSSAFLRRGERHCP